MITKQNPTLADSPEFRRFGDYADIYFAAQPPPPPPPPAPVHVLPDGTPANPPVNPTTSANRTMATRKAKNGPSTMSPAAHQRALSQPPRNNQREN